MTHIEMVAEMRKLGVKAAEFSSDFDLMKVEFWPPDPPTPVFADKATAEVYEDIKRHSEAADAQLLYHSS